MNPAQAERGRARLVVGTVVLALLLYGLTCAPGVLWQDSAMFQFRVWHGDVKGDLGLPLAHPLYVVLAKAFSFLPLGNFAFRVNLFSAVCGAAALGFVVDLLLSLTRSRFATIVGTVLLAVSHTFWTHAVIAEVYQLYAAGLVVELWLLHRFFTRPQARWLTLAFLVNGLGLANHHLALLHLPAYVGIVVWALRARRIRPMQLLLLVVAFLCGASLYLGLVIDQIVAGQPFMAALREALVGPPQRAGKVLAFGAPTVGQFARSVQYFVLNFPTPLVCVAPVGAYLAWQNVRTRWFTLVAGSLFVIAYLFAFRYSVPDQYVFFFPCYVLLPVFVALALPAWIGEAAGRKVLCLVLAWVPVVVYEIVPPMLARRNVAIGIRRHIPCRNTYVYFLQPRKRGEDSAARFAEAVFERASPDGLLIADATIANVLVYVRDVEGVGRSVALTPGGDITPAQPRVPLTPEGIAPFAERGAAFACSNAAGYVPTWILDEYDLVPVGGLFKLAKKPPR